MAQQVFGPAAVVSVLNRALTDTSPSNAVFANQVASAGVTDASQLDFAKAFGAQFAEGRTAAELSDLLMHNMGLSNDLLSAALTDYIDANGKENIGIIAWQLSSLLSGLESDATYGAAALAWNNEVTEAYQYSSNAANTTPSTGGTTGNEAAKSFVLTTAQDVLTGSLHNDFFRGVAGQPVGAQEQTTFNSSDILDGAGGVDSLILNLVGHYNGGARVKNIENLVLGSNVAGQINFDFNVNAGFNEISNVQTIEYDQINVGERVVVNNIVKTAGDDGDQIATLLWDNEAGSVAGAIDANFRASAVAGATNLNIVLDDVMAREPGAGSMTIGGGVETFTITSQGSTPNTLNPGANFDGQWVDLVSGSNDGTNDNGTLTKVVINGDQAFGRAAGVTEGGAFYGLTNRAADGAGSDWGLDNTRASASNLTSVAGTVTEVDASETTGGVAIDFVGRVSNAPVNVTFKGGSGNDYVEFELGTVTATGGAGDDTFAFVSAKNNGTFGSTDSIDGGDGTDTIQIGLNGARTYNISATEFNNKGSIEVLDLRGQVNNITLSQEFVNKADTTLTVRSDKIVQTSATDSGNNLLGTPAANLLLEDRSVTTLDTTNLDQNTGLIYLGGSGSDRLILDNESFNQFVELDGGTNMGQGAVAGPGDYDTLTVRNSAVLDRGDLANVKNFEGLVLVKTDAAAQYTIELTEAFLLANTKTNDLNAAYGETDIRDQTFFIGTTNAANSNALSFGDTVNVDITDLLTAGGTLKTSLAANGGRGLDLTSLVNAGVTVNYIFNGAPATAGQILAVTQNDATGVASVIGASPAIPMGNQPIVFTGTSGDTTSGFEIAGNRIATAGNDTIVVNGLGLSAMAVINGGGGTDTLQLNDGSGIAVGATIANIELTEINGDVAIGNALQYAQLGTVTGTGLADSVTITAAANSTIATSGSVETYNLFGAVNWIVGGVSSGATGQTFNMGTNLTKADQIFGGTGTGDVVRATTASADAFDLVTGVETLVLGAGTTVGVTVVAGTAGALQTIDASAVTAGNTYDLSAAIYHGVTVNLNATNGIADTVKVTTLVADIAKAHSVSGLGAGDTVNAAGAGGGTVYTVNLATFNVATFAGDVNALLAANAAYVAAANDLVLVQVGGSSTNVYAVEDITGNGVDGTDAVVHLVGTQGVVIDGAVIV